MRGERGLARRKGADLAAAAKASKREPDDGEHLAASIMKIYATSKPIVAKITGLIK